MDGQNGLQFRILVFYGFQGNRKRSFNGYGLSGFLKDLDVVVFQDWVGLFGGFGYFVLADTKM